jgi:hypothetical protein
MKSLVVLVLLGAPTFASAAPADWKALADCAAAYRANSQIKDPDRAPSMKAMISDEADAYLKAALPAYRAATKATAAKAQMALKAYVAKRAPDFARQNRDAIDHFINACPQPGG